MSQLRRKKGFVLIAMACAAFAVLGAAGLVVDLGRMFISRNEAQTYTDFVALAAAQQLNGKASGITAAVAEIGQSANKWGFALTSFSGTQMRFSKDGTTWLSQADAEASPIGVSYVEVTQSVTSQLFMIAVVTGSTTGTAGARSVAGIVVEPPTPGSGIGTLPFTPLTHETDGTTTDTCLGTSTSTPPCNDGSANTIWGYSIGDEITLRWPSATKTDCIVGVDDGCEEDLDYGNGNNDPANRYCDSDKQKKYRDWRDAARSTSERGYFEYNSASTIGDVVTGEEAPDFSISIGSTITTTTGVKATISDALEDRVAQDPAAGQAINYNANNLNSYNDYMLLDYPDERENWRLGVVPITDQNGVVLGFMDIFLPETQDKSGNKSLCAQFVGVSGFQGSGTGSGGSSGVRVVKLID